MDHTSKFDKDFLEMVGYTGNNDIRTSVQKSLEDNLNNSNNIELKDICFRYQNWYINDEEENEKLKLSIRENGLISPIAVVEIRSFLDNEDISPKEREYLEKMRNEYGCRYFIVSGHRRYRVVLEIETGKKFRRRKDIYDFYKNYDGNPTASCVILDVKDPEQENNIYNETNLTSRGGVSAIEYIVNEEASLERERYRKGIKKKITNKELQQYIKEKWSITIPEGTMENIRTILKTSDDDVLELIFENKLPIRQAKYFVPQYNREDEDLKRSIIESIWEDKFNIQKYIEKPKAKKSFKWSKGEVTRLLQHIQMAVKNEDKSIVEQYIKLVEDDEWK